MSYTLKCQPRYESARGDAMFAVRPGLWRYGKVGVENGVVYAKVTVGEWWRVISVDSGGRSGS